MGFPKQPAWAKLRSHVDPLRPLLSVYSKKRALGRLAAELGFSSFPEDHLRALIWILGRPKLQLSRGVGPRVHSAGAAE